MKALVVSLMCLVLLCPACEPDFQNSDSAFSIVSVEKEDKQIGGFAKIHVTVRNNSGFSGNCAAYIKIKNGNTVIENGSLIYSNLNGGESQIEEAWFSKFDRHSEYDQAVIELYWTADGIDHTRTYTY